MFSFNNIRLIRFEPVIHASIVYEWFYLGEYQEFFPEFSEAPDANALAAVLVGSFMVALKSGEIIGCFRMCDENPVSRNFELKFLIKDPLLFDDALKCVLNFKLIHSNFYKCIVKSSLKSICDSIGSFGFFKEGVLKKHLFLNGFYADVCIYGILKKEFKKIYERELSLVNKGAENGLI